MAVKVPTVSEIRAWPVTVDVQTAGRAFGLGRDQAYRLAREGDFPVPVLRLGRYLRVSRAAVLRVLDVDQADHFATSASPLDANAIVDDIRPGG